MNASEATNILEMPTIAPAPIDITKSEAVTSPQSQMAVPESIIKLRALIAERKNLQAFNPPWDPTLVKRMPGGKSLVDDSLIDAVLFLEECGIHQCAVADHFIQARLDLELSLQDIQKVTAEQLAAFRLEVQKFRAGLAGLQSVSVERAADLADAVATHGQKIHDTCEAVTTTVREVGAQSAEEIKGLERRKKAMLDDKDEKNAVLYEKLTTLRNTVVTDIETAGKKYSRTSSIFWAAVLGGLVTAFAFGGILLAAYHFGMIGR